MFELTLRKIFYLKTLRRKVKDILISISKQEILKTNKDKQISIFKNLICFCLEVRNIMIRPIYII